MQAVKKDVKYPCMNCKYFVACGEKSRTEKCEGREIGKKRRKRIVFS